MNKICSKCGEEKDVSLFCIRNDRKNRIRSYCKRCEYLRRKDYSVEYRKTSPKFQEWLKKYKQKGKDKIAFKKYHKSKRLQVLTKVGNGSIKCVNCGCDDYRMLEINHKNGGGREEHDRYNTHGFYKIILNGQRSLEDLELTCRVCNALHYLILKFGTTKHKVIYG